MSDLEEKQYELDGRVVFGLDCPVGVTEDGWTPGDANLTTQDVPMPDGDGVRMGKDFRGSSTWPFKLFADGQSEQEGWANLNALTAVWRDPAIRGESGRVVPLRYRVADQTRVIYGRPRRFTPVPNNFSLSGRIDIAADFSTVDELAYEDELQQQTIHIAPPVDAEAGLMVPFIGPFTSGARASTREESVTIGGSVPTPLMLEFSGPLAEGRVEAPGWKAVLLDPVADDDPVTIDARPWVRSATKRSGGGVRVSPRVTRISNMWLPPGEHALTFTGIDSSSTATVTVRWRNAHRSPR